MKKRHLNSHVRPAGLLVLQGVSPLFCSPCSGSASNRHPIPPWKSKSTSHNGKNVFRAAPVRFLFHHQISWLTWLPEKENLLCFAVARNRKRRQIHMKEGGEKRAPRSGISDKDKSGKNFFFRRWENESGLRIRTYLSFFLLRSELTLKPLLFHLPQSRFGSSMKINLFRLEKKVTKIITFLLQQPSKFDF